MGRWAAMVRLWGSVEVDEQARDLEERVAEASARLEQVLVEAHEMEARSRELTEVISRVIVLDD